MPDPIRKRSGYGQLWPLRPACSQNRAGSYIIMPDPTQFPHPFQFRFSKEGMEHLAQNRPGSHLNGLVMVWPNASGLEASRCAGIIGHGFWQDATGPLPVPHFQTRFRSSTDIPDKIVQNQPGYDLVLADCVRFWQKRIRSGSKPMCKNRPARFWPMLPSRSGPDANGIRHVYWGSLPYTGLQSNTTKQLRQKQRIKCPTSHFPPRNCCLSVHCSLKKDVTPKFRMLYFVTIYSVFNLTSYVFGSSKTRI